MTPGTELLERAQAREKRRRMNGIHAPDDGAGGSLDSSRRIVRIKAAEQPRVVDEAEAALIAAGVPVYVRAGQFVRPIMEAAPAADGRTTVVARLKALCADSTTDLLGRVAVFQRWSETRRTWSPVDPPRWVPNLLLARAGEWSLPPISGVITAPTLRPDGSLLDAEGYDPATRLYVVLDSDFRLPPIPASPTRRDAKLALALLTDLVSGFPFVGLVDRAVALSGMLTTLVRATLPVVPLHAIRAHTSGTGKSYLVDLFAAIATGRACPATPAGKTEEETEKRLAAHLLQGDAIVSLDNVNGELGGDMLCQMTERTIVRPRILGRSEAPEIECRAMVFATGNNLTMVGDMTRRTVLCALDAGVERPETRAFPFKPVERVLADRGLYVAAALTILRAYRTAGSPGRCPEIGSYGVWSDTVRSALVWLDEADPVASMEILREEDPEALALRSLVAHWHDHLILGAPYTAAQVIALASETDQFSGLLRPDFLEMLLRQAGEVGSGRVVSAKRLGRWLSRIKGKVADGYRIEVQPDKAHGNRFILAEADREPG